jgi:acyl-CoA synthetase (NDP forming)
VLKVSTLDLLFDVTRLLLSQPVPAGPRVAILSNSSGPARLAVDACRGAGLVGAALSAGTESAISDAVPMATHVANPLDLTFQAQPQHFEVALRHLLDDDSVDAVITIYAPPLLEETDAVTRAIARGAEGSRKPVVATILGASPRRGSVAPDLAVPVFAFPEEAARALGRVARYGQWLAEPEGERPHLADTDPDGALRMVEAYLAERPDGLALDHVASTELVNTFGIEVVAERLVHSAEEAVAAAATIGYPVVLKATGLERLAKTESGGLAVDLHSDTEVRQSYERMMELLGDAMRPAIVQAMAEPGVDVAVRLVQSPEVGSILSIGHGGMVLDQVGVDSLRFLPLTDLDAERLVDQSRLEPLLPAGSPGRAALVDVVARVAGLAEAVPEVAELLLNPVIVAGSTAAVTDARIRLRPWPDRDLPVRRLDAD